ncbi:chorismate pyruvate-lyase family protein [Streptosporangium sp. NPDC048047]|uniref:chorismate--pyruvate lyase family protein n=1 Tax=Streptosporangium sp. NPDC048047 TaxID=3155748 RepID=UPI00343A7B96
MSVETLAKRAAASSSPGPITRLALAHDGSTTRFLTYLLGQRLHVRVISQRRRPAIAVLPPVARAQFHPAAGQFAIARRSQLVRSDGSAVSSNRVVMVNHPVVNEVVHGGSTPLGLVLRDGGIEQRRQILQYGARRQAWAPDAENLLSPCRSYVIMISGNPVFYIEETFHPDVIPADGLPLVHLSAGDKLAALDDFLDQRLMAS